VPSVQRTESRQRKIEEIRCKLRSETTCGRGCVQDLVSVLSTFHSYQKTALVSPQRVNLRAHSSVKQSRIAALAAQGCRWGTTCQCVRVPAVETPHSCLPTRSRLQTANDTIRLSAAAPATPSPDEDNGLAGGLPRPVTTTPTTPACRYPGRVTQGGGYTFCVKPARAVIERRTVSTGTPGVAVIQRAFRERLTDRQHGVHRRATQRRGQVRWERCSTAGTAPRRQHTRLQTLLHMPIEFL
jgi:hypothetical protein